MIRRHRCQRTVSAPLLYGNVFASASVHHRAGLVLLSLVSAAAIGSLINYHGLTIVAVMACIPDCSILVPLSLGLMPVALGGGAVLGWMRRSRASLAVLALWVLGPFAADVILSLIGTALTNARRV